MLLAVSMRTVVAGLICIPSCSFGMQLEAAKAIVTGFNKPIEPKLGEFPYHAALLLVDEGNGTPLIFCGGSLIHPRWILTAAHCLEQDGKQFPPGALKVALGSVHFDLRSARIADVTKVVIKREYFVNDGHDIGLLMLTKPVRLTKSVNIVRLYLAKPKESLMGRTAFLVGFGIVNDFRRTPRRLREAILHVNAPEKCRLNANDSVHQICCTSTIYEGKACKGDSGSPLVIKANGTFYQIGITSRLAILPICKLTFNHSVYTRVAAFVQWITDATGIDIVE